MILIYFCIVGINGTNRESLRVENNRQSLKGFADNIEERRERETIMKIYEDDIIYEVYKDETKREGKYLLITDKYMQLCLYSDKLEGNEPTEIEEREAETLINMLNSREILEKIDSGEYGIGELLLLIRVKSAKNKDFLKWWQGYGFKMKLHWFNSGEDIA